MTLLLLLNQRSRKSPHNMTPLMPDPMGSKYLCTLESSVCIFASCHIRFAWCRAWLFSSLSKWLLISHCFRTRQRGLCASILCWKQKELLCCFVPAGLWPQAVPQADAATGGHGSGGSSSAGRSGSREYSRTRKCWWNRACSQWVSASFTANPWGQNEMSVSFEVIR